MLEELFEGLTDRLINPWEIVCEVVLRYWRSIEHLRTCSLGTCLVVGLASGLWTPALFVLGVALTVCWLFPRELNPGRWPGSWLDGVLGLCLVGATSPMLGIGWQTWALLLGSLLWEYGWRRWEHKNDLDRLSRYNNDNFPHHARQWAAIGLMLAWEAAIAYS